MSRKMTEGAPWPHLLHFTGPLLLSNIFQQLYNLADIAIVGNFCGPKALAGMGAAAPVFALLNALLIGISIGASILTSQLYGAGKTQLLPTASATILLTSVGSSLLLICLGQILIKPLLVLMQTPDEIMEYAISYLRIIIGGLFFPALFNQFSGLLRGLGDSLHPLYFLAFASVANVALDLLFVAHYSWGVAGAAVATLIAQALSALLCCLYIMKKVPLLHFHHAPQAFSSALFRASLRFGIPMGLHQASISLGHVIMQGMVNSFGTAVIAAYAIVAKIDMFAVMPVISLGSAASTFAAQNAGAGDYQRIKKGYLTTNAMVVAIFAVLTPTIFFSRHLLLKPFVSGSAAPDLTAQVIAIGAEYLAILPLFYLVLGLIHSTLNIMAGAGDTTFNTVAMILMMALRIVAAWFFINQCGLGYTGIWWAFPASWIITLIPVMLRYGSGAWQKKAVV